MRCCTGIVVAEPVACEATERAPGPLRGYRVLDLTSVIMGPFATQILGDLGAEVISVESPLGDLNRVMSPGPHAEMSGIAVNILRNKRNVSLDLKDPRGREALLRIAHTCDVLVTNLRPQSLERLQLTYPYVAAASPDIVYCQAQGFPSDGPRANDPAYDDIIQSAGGVAAAFDAALGRPGLAPTIMADKVCGLTIVYAVLAGLLYRLAGGSGQHIEVPMVDVMTAFTLVEHGAGAIFEPGGGHPGYGRILTPYRRPQRTADGWIHILPYTAVHYDALFAYGGRRDLVGDRRCADLPACIANSDFLYCVIEAMTPGHTTAQWLSLCCEHQIPATHIPSLADLVAALPSADHPLFGSYKQIPPPVRFSATPSGVHRAAPLIGQDTAEVLAEVGCSAAEVEYLSSTRRPGRAPSLLPTIRKSPL
jgi:crotonobetainyl-CoA:carnitine CoA-transferase CaiB-like acyl-CoA transferase